MPYSERAYFEGDHCQHCADRDEHLRLAQIHKCAVAAVRMERRQNSRRLAA